MKVTNCKGEESGILGKERFEWSSVEIGDKSIQKITVYKKNEEYLRGFRIYFRDGSSELINTDQGHEAGTIDF